MRDDIKGLKLCGGNFVPEAGLMLFPGTPSNQKKVACSILYGRNGSGKSTIARAFRQMYSFEEKQRTAKETLCLLYLLNREHVLAHLGNGENRSETRQVEKDIKDWCEDIKGQVEQTNNS